MKRSYLIALTLIGAGHMATASPTANNVFSGKVISQISDGQSVTTLSYNDAMQLIGADTSTPYGSSKVSFDYTPGTYNTETYDIVMTLTDPGETITCYLTLGENGYVSRSYEVEESFGEVAEHEVYTFSYNVNGQLSEVSESDFLDSETYTFFYDSTGDITMSSKRGSDNDNETYTIAYSSTAQPQMLANKGAIMDFDLFGFDSTEASYLYYAGLLGKPTTHLPITSIEKEANGDTTSSSIKWTLGTDGFPTAMREFEGRELEAQMIFTWRDIAAVKSIEMEESDGSVVGYYDLMGKKHAQPLRGLNIVKMSDGTTKKILNY